MATVTRVITLEQLQHMACLNPEDLTTEVDKFYEQLRSDHKFIRAVDMLRFCPFRASTLPSFLRRWRKSYEYAFVQILSYFNSTVSNLIFSAYIESFRQKLEQKLEYNAWCQRSLCLLLSSFPFNTAH
jgi:hypothetical protein